MSGAKKLMTLSAIALSAAACAEGAPAAPEVDPTFAFGRAGAVYEVTIENLAEGQPLTPPVIVTHRASTDLFEVGEPASIAVSQIAENGNLDPMLAMLGEDTHVSEFLVAPGPEIPPVRGGESITVEISASLGATRLSWVSMLICTNDGFTGVDALELPVHIGDIVERYTSGYDAGSETNTESFDDIVPPCGPLTGVDSGGRGTGMSDPGLTEGGVIRHHPGIQGTADLVPEIHGWSDPVARIEIRRIG